MASQARMTKVGSELESFLDDYEEDISPNIFRKLEELGDVLDDIEKDFVEKIDELKDEVDTLKDELLEKEREIEELEIKLSEVEK